MRIGILTYHASNNYGAVLQAYALVQYLLGAGHDVEIIDYRPNMPEFYFRLFVYKRGYKVGKAANQHLDCLRNFLHTKVKMSPICRCKSKLCDVISHYDAIVCGSDEIWNIRKRYRGFNRNFFLDGLANGCIRVSYAATFNNTRVLRPKEKSIIQKALQRFDALSVRDSMSMDLLQEMGIQGAERVIDPTLLVCWDTFAQEVAETPERYVLAYIQKGCNHVAAAKVVKRLAQEYSLPVRALVPAPDWHGGSALTPEQWVGMYKNATMIVTNAFHGVMFAVAMKKPWIAIKSSQKRKIDDFASWIGKTECVIAPDAGVSEYAYLMTQYTEYEDTLRIPLQESKAFLHRVFS